MSFFELFKNNILYYIRTFGFAVLWYLQKDQIKFRVIYIFIILWDV